jgi:hypothetical protein
MSRGLRVVDIESTLRTEAGLAHRAYLLYPMYSGLTGSTVTCASFIRIGLHDFDAGYAPVVKTRQPMEIRNYQESDRGAVISLWNTVFSCPTGHNDPDRSIDQKVTVNQQFPAKGTAWTQTGRRGNLGEPTENKDESHFLSSGPLPWEDADVYEGRISATI